jgi:hypothetical protein
MKRQHFFTATLAALTALSLFGCGGGSGGNSGSSTDATRELLAGKGTAASPTAFYWRTVSIKASTTYYNSTGNDQTCPVTITGKNGALSTGCSEDQIDAYRSDGKILYDVVGTPNWNSATDTFTIDGSVVTVTDSTATDPTETKTIVAEVISQPTGVGGAPRLRLRIKSETLVNGTSKPNNVGLEVVLEGVI